MTGMLLSCSTIGVVICSQNSTPKKLLSITRTDTCDDNDYQCIEIMCDKPKETQDRIDQLGGYSHIQLIRWEYEWRCLIFPQSIQVHLMT